MQVLPSRLDGPILIEPAIHRDERGFFCETYRREWHAAASIPEHEEFIQDNHSRSTRGVVRGMHFQIGQGVAKLVRCSRGEILDVVVDLRRGSPTYGDWEGFTLDDISMRCLYVPIGFAHGFCVLSQIADVAYKQTGYYDGAVEHSIAWDDPEIAIEWPTGLALSVSPRDGAAPHLREIEQELPFVYGQGGAASS
jgi:dTDP-4-dehydrorhamnose 3,5-epimerase